MCIILDSPWMERERAIDSVVEGEAVVIAGCQRNEEGAARGKVEVEGEGGAGERQEKRVEEGEMRQVEGWEQVQEEREKARA